jgi:hypothetical protein
MAILVGYEDGSIGIQRSDGGQGPFEEVARGAEIDPAGMTIGPNAVVHWQVTLDGRSLVRTRDDAGVHDWLGPEFGFSHLEATSGRLLGTEIREIGADANLVDVVEVSLDADASLSTRTINSMVGVQAMASDSTGTTIGLGSQTATGRPLVVDVIDGRDWRVDVDTGWPNQIALAPGGNAVAVRDLSTSTLAWVDELGGTAETIIGDTPVVTFDVSSRGRIVYSTTDGNTWDVCTSEPDPAVADPRPSVR